MVQWLLKTKKYIFIFKKTKIQIKNAEYLRSYHLNTKDSFFNFLFAWGYCSYILLQNNNPEIFTLTLHLFIFILDNQSFPSKNETKQSWSYRGTLFMCWSNRVQKFGSILRFKICSSRSNGGPSGRSAIQL